MEEDPGAAGAGLLPRNLNGTGRRLLVDALVANFDRSGLEQLTRFALDRNLEEISDGENLRDAAFDLVEWAGARGRLDALVAGALAENPGSPALRTFERDVWSDPRMAAPPDDGGDADAEGASSRKPSPGVLIAIVALIAAIGILAIWLATRGQPGAVQELTTTPSVTITNARLRQVETNASGDELLNIAFDLALTNAVGWPVRIEAVALDAGTGRAAPVAATPTPQEIRAERAEDGGVGEILVPFPLNGGCIVVRVAALDDDGDELDDDQTARFDPYDPANPDCPATAA